MDTLYFQSEFFHRFIQNYPQAIQELKEMLPLFQVVFGPEIEIDVMDWSSLWATHRFDDRFLIQPERMLPHCNESSYDYQTDYFRREPTVPEFIRMSDDHPYKVNEGWYKRLVETSIVWGIAELRAETGDKTLLDYLKTLKELKEKKREEFAELAQNYCQENSVNATESDISIAAYQLTDKYFEDNNLYRYEGIEPLLSKFWEFYEKFHNWITKYYLSRAWLRRSFFIALRRGLKSFWADIGSPIHLPIELQTELYGSATDRLGFVRPDLPSPEAFQFKIERYTKNKKTPVTTNEKWQANGYSLFDTPPQYEEKVVEEFSQAVNQVEFFEGEEQLVTQFHESLKESLPDSVENEEQNIEEFRNHFRQFPFLQSISANRRQVILDFQKHIRSYLDRLLPIISNHLRTKEGALPKFERINWLLNWNIENLTAREIVEKYNLSDESTFWKALDDFKIFNLPIREKSSDKIEWNDDWFLERIKSGYPDLKKLKQKSAKKN